MNTKTLHAAASKNGKSCGGCRHAHILTASYWDCAWATVGARSPLYDGGCIKPRPDNWVCQKWEEGKFDINSREYMSDESRSIADFFAGMVDECQYVKVVKPNQSE